MKTYAFIFARGGSKGLPGKNIKDLNGKPMLAYSIEIAQQIDSIDRVFVSTDDKEIAAIAEKYNAEIINRPIKLAQDNSAEWEAWKHAVTYVNKKYGQFDIFISLPTTAPLRNKDDVKSCLSTLTQDIDIVITVSESDNNPFFNMVQLGKSGQAQLFNKSETTFTRRQDVPKAFNITTVAYATKPEFIMKSNGIFNGKVHAVKIPQERAIDIDTITDFKIAECLLKTSLGN